MVPGEAPLIETAYAFPRGLIATIEIGVECKVLAKPMIKQIDRVMKDLREQIKDFNRGTGSKPITVAVVGVNHAAHTVGYEGSRAWPTGWIENVDAEAIKRLNEDVRPHYDEMIVLRYQATNAAPYPFAWVDKAATQREYATVLTNISREYEQRF